MTKPNLWRTTFFACLIIGLCFLFTAVLAAVSWEGDLNPTEFGKWEVVGVAPMSGPDYRWYIIKNPDESSGIRFIMVIYRREDARLMEYRYFKDGEPYVFDYDEEADKYWQDILPNWKKKQCLSCHKPKIKEKEI